MQSALLEHRREPATRIIYDCRRITASPSNCGAGRVWAGRKVRECADMEKRITGLAAYGCGTENEGTRAHLNRMGRATPLKWETVAMTGQPSARQTGSPS